MPSPRVVLNPELDLKEQFHEACRFRHRAVRKDVAEPTRSNAVSTRRVKCLNGSMFSSGDSDNWALPHPSVVPSHRAGVPVFIEVIGYGS